MIRCKVEDVLFDKSSNMGVVLLVEEDGERILPIWIGLYETQAILLKMRNYSTARPLTHDLLRECINRLNGVVKYIYISDVVNNVFHAKIYIEADKKEIIIDSRPSDAIALALRANCDIYIDKKILDSNGIDREEFMKKQKKSYIIESVDPSTDEIIH